MQPGRGIRNRDRMLGTALLGDLALEALNRRPLGEKFGYQNSAHRCDILLINILPAVGDHQLILSNSRISDTVRKCGLLPELYSKPSATGTPSSPEALRP